VTTDPIPRTELDWLPIVRSLIGEKVESYRGFLERLEDDLEKFKDRVEFSGKIYRIYSRKDKQRGRAPLKSTRKIARKLADWIQGNLKELDKDARPHPKVTDIHDIIGLTVVTYYEADVEIIVDELMKPKALSSGRIKRNRGRSGTPKSKEDFWRDERGYSAYHLVFESLPPLGGLYCEVQIKSLLMDGWGQKNHDLTYKPLRPISSRLVKLSNLLGETVKTLEQQSNVLRELVEAEVLLERKHRDAACQSLFDALEDPQLANEAPNVASKIKELVQEIRTKREVIRVCDQTDARLTDVFEKWDGLFRQARKRPSTYQPLCRIQTLLASMRNTREYDAGALEAIDTWIAFENEKVSQLEAANAPSETIVARRLNCASALAFRAIALFSFHDFPRAVAETRNTLTFCRTHLREEKEKIETYNRNLLYFLAEEFYQKAETERDQKNLLLSEIRGLLPGAMTRAKAAYKSLTKQEKCGQPATLEQSAQVGSALDTIGAVLITTGDTVAEIRAGLEMCRAGLALSSRSVADQQATQAFFGLHERRAFIRLLSIE